MNLSLDAPAAHALPIGLAVRQAASAGGTGEYAELFIRDGRSEFGVRLRADELEQLRDLATEALAAFHRPRAALVADDDMLVGGNVVFFRPRP